MTSTEFLDGMSNMVGSCCDFVLILVVNPPLSLSHQMRCIVVPALQSLQSDVHICNRWQLPDSDAVTLQKLHGSARIMSLRRLAFVLMQRKEGCFSYPDVLQQHEVMSLLSCATVSVLRLCHDTRLPHDFASVGFCC